jgi:putative lipoic acid-binding regulatory protein
VTREEEQQEPKLEFPCEFPLKVIGINEDDFESFAVEVVERHVPDLDHRSISHTISGGGKYLSVSFMFLAESREQMDDLYRELTASERVKWVL